MADGTHHPQRHSLGRILQHVALLSVEHVFILPTYIGYKFCATSRFNRKSCALR